MSTNREEIRKRLTESGGDPQQTALSLLKTAAEAILTAVSLLEGKIAATEPLPADPELCAHRRTTFIESLGGGRSELCHDCGEPVER